VGKHLVRHMFERMGVINRRVALRYDSLPSSLKRGKDHDVNRR
jgi:hypothetical protein